MNAVRPIRIQPDRAITFKAWIVGTPKEEHARDEAHPVDLPDHIDSEQAAADFAASELTRDRSIVVLRSDAAERPERRNLVSIFTVARKNAGWETPANGGRAKAVYRCIGKLVCQFCVRDGFDPVRPWRMEDGNAAGHDLTLVQG